MIRDPATGQPFPGNRDSDQPHSSLRVEVPVAVRAAPNVNEPGINYRGPALPRPINQDQYVSRVDHTFNTKDSLYGSYIYNIQADDTVPTFTFDSRGNRARRKMRASPNCISSRAASSMKSVQDGTGSSSMSSSEPLTTRVRHCQHHRLARCIHTTPRLWRSGVHCRLHSAHRPHHRTPRPAESDLAGLRQPVDPYGRSRDKGRHVDCPTELDVR